MKGIEGHYKAKVTDSPDKRDEDGSPAIRQKTFTPAFSCKVNLQEKFEFWELCLQNDTMSWRDLLRINHIRKLKQWPLSRIWTASKT